MLLISVVHDSQQRMLLCVQVSCNQRGRNASQLNLGGTGLGSFNDRFRDSIVGGSPFGPVQFQGFASGLGTQPSAFMQACTQLLLPSRMSSWDLGPQVAILGL